MNHRRPNAPVGHCPDCGAVVNASIRVGACTDAAHAGARRRQLTYCVDCGTRLIVAR
jgi:hypothetical protein